jgi:putative transposase
VSHSLSHIWVHAVSGTKDRRPLIDVHVEQKIYRHLEEQLVEMDCRVKIINGMPDHVHLLFRQNPRIGIEEIMKQIKGNTSYWINHNDILREKFGWQTGYGAFSVSESQLRRVSDYIFNQKNHHRRMTFDTEYDAFLKAHEWEDTGQNKTVG